MTTDDGLRFFATITKRIPQEAPIGETLYLSASVLSRETEDRGLLLAWLATHYEAGDGLTVTVEATGAAALTMVAALQVGARRLREATADTALGLDVSVLLDDDPEDER